MNMNAVKMEIEESKSLIPVKGLMIWGLATVFYFFDNLLMLSPAAMKPELSQAFSSSATSLGALSACYLWAYGLMQIPAGVLMDRVGPRKVLTFASFMCAIGCYLFSIAPTLTYAMLGRVFIGIGASFAVVGCCKLSSVWFSPKRFALFIGLMVSVGMSGSAFGSATVYRIIQAFSSWREPMFFASWAAFALAIIMWIVIRDKPNEFAVGNGLNTEVEAESILSIRKSLHEVIFCSQAWYLAIFAGIMFMPTLTFGALWGTSYLIEAHSFTRDEAGFLAGLIFIGWIFGGPVYGWFSDFIGRRHPPMIFANFSTLILMLVIIFATNLSIWQIGTLMFLLGFCSSGFVLAFVVMRENNRHELAGTSTGFMNMMNTFVGGAAFQLLIGVILDWVSKDAVMTAEGKVFSLADYRLALLCIPVSLLISLFMIFKIKETYCKSKVRIDNCGYTS